MGLLDLLVGRPRATRRVLNARVDGRLVREALGRHGRFRVLARGGSMNPVIPDGATVTVVPLTLQGARVGDVVMACYGEHLYTLHRVVRGSPGGVILTKGDSLDGMDPPVGTPELLGRVVAYEVRGRRVRLDRGILYRAGPLLAALSRASLVGRFPLRYAPTSRAAAIASRVACRALRAPAWILAWCLVRLSSRPAGRRSSGRDTGRSGDHSPGGATGPSSLPPGCETPGGGRTPSPGDPARRPRGAA